MIDFSDSGVQPAQVIDVATDADTEIRLVPGQELTLAPIGKQADGATDNAIGDYVACAFAGDAPGAPPDLTAGRKLILWSGLGSRGDVAARSIKLSGASEAAPGYAVVKLRAVGHSAKVQAIVG